MSDNKKIEATEVVEAAETTEIAEIAEIVENTATKYTLDYVLEQIEKLQQHIAENPLNHLRYSVGSIYSNDINETTDEDDSDSYNVEKSRSDSVSCVCEIYRYREETLKQMLAFYEKMYDDLKPKPTPEPDPVNEAIERMVAEFVSRKADYVADRSHQVNAEEFESIFKEIEQVRYLRERI